MEEIELRSGMTLYQLNGRQITVYKVTPLFVCWKENGWNFRSRRDVIGKRLFLTRSDALRKSIESSKTAIRHFAERIREEKSEIARCKQVLKQELDREATQAASKV